MKFRKLMLVLTFVVTAVFVSVIGATYAYYVTASGNINLTTGSSDNVVGVVFNSDNYIDLNTGVPISPLEVEKYAGKSKFTLTPNLEVYNKYDFDVVIGLSNIDIDDELKVKDFKYRLICNHKLIYVDGAVNYGESQVFNGTAKDFSGKTHEIARLSTTEIDEGRFSIDSSSSVSSQMQECTFYVWLEENGSDQNNLMNKHFSSNITVSTITKKR